LPPDWRDCVAAHNGHVLELSETDQRRLSAGRRPPFVALPDFAVLRFQRTTYVLIWERDLAFDAERAVPAFSLGDAETDADAVKAATAASIYSVGPELKLTHKCEIEGQYMGVMLGGF
jgi:hypothetical protein